MLPTGRIGLVLLYTVLCIHSGMYTGCVRAYECTAASECAAGDDGGGQKEKEKKTAAQCSRVVCSASSGWSGRCELAYDGFEYL